MTENLQLEQLTREAVKLALALAKKTWKTNPSIMIRGVVLEEENDIPEISVLFCSNDSRYLITRNVSITVNSDGKLNHWANKEYDKTPIEKDDKVE